MGRLVSVRKLLPVLPVLLVMAVLLGGSVASAQYGGLWTYTTASNASGAVGESVTLTATVSAWGYGGFFPVPNATVTFRVVTGWVYGWPQFGATIGTAQTSAGGVAQISYNVPALGTMQYAAVYGGAFGYMSSQGYGTVTGTAVATSLDAVDVSGYIGGTVQLSATLTALGAPLAGRTIDFTCGAFTDSAVTGADGVATVDMPVTFVGDQDYTATFAGSAGYLGSSDTATVTGLLNPTGLVADDVSGNVGQTVPLTATLTGNGAPIAGATIDFSVEGWTASATTDAAGIATVPYTIMSMGDKTLEASYAGSGFWAPATDDATVSVYNNVTTIGLFLSQNPINAGDTTVATVVDKNGNIITAVANVYIQAGAGGSWAGNVYSSQKVGTWVVTATYGPLGDTENLVVNRGAVADVQISPDVSTIASNQTQTYTVQASDGQGNSWAPDAADVTWTTDGAGAFAGNTYTPDAADEGSTLDNYATVGGVDSNHAALTVNPAGGAGLILAWDKDDQNFYLCSNPADPQSAGAAGLISGAANGTFTVNGVQVTVTGSTNNRTVSVNNTAGIANTLQVRWYVRSGAVSQAYAYSTIANVKNNATFTSGRTFIDGQYKTGFWGVTHALDAADPTSITYGATQQP